MLTAKSIDKKITTLLTGLNIQQKKAVLTVVKTFAESKSTESKEDDYVIEMNNRFLEIENDQVKGFTIQQTISAAKKAYKTKQKR